MAYDFEKIEQKWIKEWEQHEAFKVSKSDKPKFYCVEMFPYPSGEGLHIGHTRNYSIADAIARFKRMQGYNVLYPVGYDAFGLPAENAAIKHNVDPEKWTTNNIAVMRSQQKRLGFSYDWSRELATCFPSYYKWNQWFFLKMFERGLVYRKKAPVNYCPQCKTVLANEQVIDGKCWRCKSEVQTKLMEQWFIKITDYADRLLESLDKLDWPEQVKVMQRNWIGKSHGVEIDFELVDEQGNSYDKLVVFTTRPDTLFGVTFIVIAPEHEKLLELVKGKPQEQEVKEFIEKVQKMNLAERQESKLGVFTGLYARNPATNEIVPVYTANFVLPYATGIVMAVPAHDQRDFEFAKAYGLPIKQVIQPNLLVVAYVKPESINKLTQSLKDFYFYYDAEKFLLYVKASSTSYAQLVNLLKQHQAVIWNDGEVIVLYNNRQFKPDEVQAENLHEELKKLLQFDQQNWRDFIASELLQSEMNKAYEQEGILINSGQFTGMSSAEAINAITEWLESIGKGRKAVYYRIKDWLISRQRYWGTPIPIVYCDKCGIVPVPYEQLPVVLPKASEVRFGEGNPLATCESFVNTSCPKCNGPAKRETDTMDTFVDSSWYFLRYIDNNNDELPFDKEKADYFMPIDFYIGGIEHATGHLIYCRFFTKFIHDLGMLKHDEPARKLLCQGMVTLGGVAMSKSLGNVVNPLDVIKRYGADTLRAYLLFAALPEKQLEWQEKGIEGIFRFVNSFYSFVTALMQDAIVKYDATDQIVTIVNSLLLSKLQVLIANVTQYLETYKLSYAIRDIMEYFKLVEKYKAIASDNVLKQIAGVLSLLLNPFTPFISEECWHLLGNTSFASLEAWPKPDESLRDQHVEKAYDAVVKLRQDINNIVRIISKKGKKPTSVYIYAIDSELQHYLAFKQELETLGLSINIEPASNPAYDPQNKASKAKQGRPAIYVE